MPRYAVSFRIDYNATYQERYDSFCEEVRRGAATWWAGTTSFFAVQSSDDLDTFCNRIYYRSKFSAACDVFLVVNIETGAGRSKGPVPDRDLYRAFPGVVPS